MSTIVFDTANLARCNEFNPGSPVYPEICPVDRVWNILTDYVQPKSSLSQVDAVDKVVQCHNSMSGASDATFGSVLYVAEQIPYHHPSHKKLADFVLALYSDERMVCKTKADSRENAERQLWDSLDKWLCETLVSPDLLLDDEPPQDPMIYANTCAFAANLVEPEWSRRRFDYGLAEWALQGAAMVRARDPEVRDAELIGAAQFIIFQAPTIFNEVLRNRKYRADVRKSESCSVRWGFVKRKPMIIYDKPFTSDQWQEWKRVFRATAQDETFGKECRAVAQQAADLMELQEKIEDDRSKEA